jgi:peptidoglycan/LPS O-acetylase OafA/YrhL
MTSEAPAYALDRERPRRPRSPVFTIALALLAILLVYLAVPNIGPTLRAARADGVPGEFTARELYCVQHPGHETCTWSGEFRADGGGVRADVAFYGADREMLQQGQRARAFDVGRSGQVYGPGGSNEWVLTFLLLLAGLALLGYLFVLTPLRARRARSREPAGGDGGVSSAA